MFVLVLVSVWFHFDLTQNLDLISCSFDFWGGSFFDFVSVSFWFNLCFILIWLFFWFFPFHCGFIFISCLFHFNLSCFSHFFPFYIGFIFMPFQFDLFDFLYVILVLFSFHSDFILSRLFFVFFSFSFWFHFNFILISLFLGCVYFFHVIFFCFRHKGFEKTYCCNQSAAPIQNPKGYCCLENGGYPGYFWDQKKSNEIQIKSNLADFFGGDFVWILFGFYLGFIWISMGFYLDFSGQRRFQRHCCSFAVPLSSRLSPQCLPAVFFYHCLFWSSRPYAVGGSPIHYWPVILFIGITLWFCSIPL